jgi:hypothetical protein
MTMGVGGPKIPPQALDVERHTADSRPMKPLTRWIVYGVLGLMTVLVVVTLVALFLAD